MDPKDAFFVSSAILSLSEILEGVKKLLFIKENSKWVLFAQISQNKRIYTKCKIIFALGYI